MMRLFILLFWALPFSLCAQKDESFARFIKEDGSIIKGSSVTQFYERQIPLFNLVTNSSANSTTIRFTMENENAVVVLRDLMLNNKKIRSGELFVTYISLEKRLVRFKINMENIAVEECNDSNGNTTIQLHATRIGWTYYTYTKSGVQTITGKSGWDEEKKRAWTNFN